MKSSIKIVISACLLLASITAQAALPQGLWKVQQVTIEKDTDGKIENTVYNSTSEVKSLYICSQEWEINAQSMVIRYADGREEKVSSYAVENNHLTLISEMFSRPLEYSISDGNLTLITAYSYINNLPTGQAERIEEKWTMVLKKQ